MRKVFLIVLNLWVFVGFAQNAVPKRVRSISDSYASEFEAMVLGDFIKGNNVNHAALLFALDSSMNLRKFGLTEKYIKEVALKMKAKRVDFHTDISYLKYVFDLIQKFYLKEYGYNKSVNNVVFSNAFDCVSGTAFYALMLEYMDIDFFIKETAHHVYLELKADGNKILIESTDKHGFIINDSKVEQTEKKYAFETTEEFAKLVGEKYLLSYEKNIGLTELAGIQYFNKASVAYLQGKYEDALLFSEKAQLLYPSERIRGLMQACLNNLMSSKEMSYKTKLSFYKKYKS